MWVHSGAPRDGRVHSSSRGFTWTLISVVGFIPSCVGSWDSFGIAWVHSGTPSGGPVHSGSLWLARTRAKWSSGSFGFAWFHFGAPRDRRRVPPGWLAITLARIGVV